MSQLVISILAFLVAIGILIAVHELGHFWVARRFGIKVLRFSIGFGRPLLRWYDKLGTEYVLSAIPLGGYVSLLGEKGQTVPPAERHMAYTYKPVLVRMLVLLAGPFFNLLFAIIAYWLVFLINVTVYAPVLGNVPKDSAAGMAGLYRGEEIIAVADKPTPSWEAVAMQLLAHMGEEKRIHLTVRNPITHELHTKSLDIEQLGDHTSEPDWLENLGLVPFDPVPPVVGKVLPDYPAFRAGLQEGDRIETVNGEKIYSRSELIQYIQTHPNTTIVLDILRGEHKIKITVIPIVKALKDGGKKIGFIGVEFPPLKAMPKNLVRIQSYGVGKAFIKAVKRTVEYSVLTLDLLKKIVLGQVSTRHISGPLVIAKYAGETASIGFRQFLDFLAMISISLGVLNLLPIPILDGGHFMYCVYECFTGRRVSEAAQVVGAWIGGILLIGFMLLAFYNDFIRFFG